MVVVSLAAAASPNQVKLYACKRGEPSVHTPLYNTHQDQQPSTKEPNRWLLWRPEPRRSEAVWEQVLLPVERLLAPWENQLSRPEGKLVMNTG
jgi:hypothetical protein